MLVIIVYKFRNIRTAICSKVCLSKTQMLYVIGMISAVKSKIHVIKYGDKNKRQFSRKKRKLKIKFNLYRCLKYVLYNYKSHTENNATKKGKRSIFRSVPFFFPFWFIKCITHFSFLFLFHSNCPSHRNSNIQLTL